MKRMRPYLLPIAALLLLAVYLLTGRGDTPLFSTVPMPEGDVVQVRYSTSSGDVQVERRGTAWFMTTPVQWPALAREVQPLVDSLRSLQVLSVATGAGEYGFSGEEITLTTATGETVLRIGSRAGKAGAVYVETGKRVYVVSDTFLSLLPSRADAWRDATVVSATAAEVMAVSLTLGQETVEVKRTPAGWTVNGKKLSGDIAGQTAGRFFPLNGTGFASEPQEPVGQLTVLSSNKSLQSFPLFRTQDGVAAGMGDGFVLLPPPFMQAMGELYYLSHQPDGSKQE